MITADHHWDVGFDLGGTKLYSFIRTPEGDQERTYPSGPLFTKGELIRIWRETLDSLPQAPRYAGIACAGLIREQVVIQSDALPGINGLSADDLVWRGVHPLLINDADAALMGQCAREPAETNFAMVMVGTNIGMSYMMNGQICTGTTGMAGELGKVPIEFQGSVFQLDQIAGGAAISRRCGCKPAEIVRGLQEGDEKITRIVDEAATLFGYSLAWLINLMNPEKLYLGGGVLNYRGFMERAVDTAQKQSLKKLFELCQIVRVEKRDSIVAEGAIEQSRRSR